MDDRQFDNLTKSLAFGTSRRQLLKGVAGALLGAAGGFGTNQAGVAFICRESGVLCDKDAECCSNLCDLDRHRCVCPEGRITCGRGCIEPCAAADSCHAAGSCDPETSQCTTPLLANGTSCGDGKECCGGTCTDLTTVTNCGACGETCGDGQGCCGGSCTDLTTVANCGSCGHTCTTTVADANPACTAGTCGFTCDTTNGASVCGNLCCPSGQTCCNGVCKRASGSACTGDADCCSGFCVHGSCNAVCSEEGAPCSDTGDCCGGSPCVSALCCSSSIACGIGCCPTSQDICNGSACCTPDSKATTCDGKCGTITSNCGQDVDCGGCTAPQTCGGGGTTNVCGCTSTTCASQGKNCGQISDGCGNTMSCGTCSGNDVCENNVCTCVPICNGAPCGDDGCGGSCGTCPEGLGCGDHNCFCISSAYTACLSAGATYPDVPCCASDGLICGPLLFCCTPGTQESVCAGKCGTVQDQCGTNFDCGGCAAPQTCGGGGTANVCGCTPQCSANNQCGPDGCGNVCGTCPANKSCVVYPDGNGICSCTIKGIACGTNNLPCCSGVCGGDGTCQ